MTCANCEGSVYSPLKGVRVPLCKNCAMDIVGKAVHDPDVPSKEVAAVILRIVPGQDVRDGLIKLIELERNPGEPPHRLASATQPDPYDKSGYV